jgi:hypothetical protein
MKPPAASVPANVGVRVVFIGFDRAGATEIHPARRHAPTWVSPTLVLAGLPRAIE